MIGNKKKTILITGINGFLGSNLAKALATNYNILGLEYGLDNLHRIKDCNFKVIDVKNGISKNLFARNKIDIIIHASAFYGRENETIKTIAHANLFLPFDLLDKAIENRCPLFINSDTVLDRFVSTYALTKRQFHEWLYIRCKSIKVINFQLEHFYGPGASDNNFISYMIKRLHRSDPIIDLTPGEQRRDFVFIKDVVNAYLTVLDRSDTLEEQFLNFEIASGQSITIKELLLQMKALTKSNTILNFGAIQYRIDELMQSNANNSALMNLGWEPKTSITDGLMEMLSSHNN